MGAFCSHVLLFSVIPTLDLFQKKPALSLIILLSVANVRYYKFAVNVAGHPQDFAGIKILSKRIKVQTYTAVNKHQRVVFYF